MEGKRCHVRASAWRSSFGRAVLIGLAGLAAFAVLAGCAPGQPGGLPAPVAQVLATSTATPGPTDTPTPPPTATPTATPTPLAAQAAGILPQGQVFFSTHRDGERSEELWRADAAGAVQLVQPGIAPGLWQCGDASQTRCAFVSEQGALQLSVPVSGTLALLDDLGGSIAIRGTLPLSRTGFVSATAAVSGSVGISLTLPASATAAVSSTQVLTVTETLSRSLGSLQLALAPDGAKLAVADQDSVKVFDLATLSLGAQLAVTGTKSLAWSPDTSLLAVAYPLSGDTRALALWNWQDGKIRSLAVMDAVGDLAWAPDGAKLAFVAHREPLAPASQGSQSDVFVAFLKSGEIANLTEVFLGNNGLAPDQQTGAWAPAWEADSATVRYVMGLPDAPETQTLMRHALRSRRPTILGAAADAGSAGIVAGPGDPIEARVVEREGRQVVQTRSDGDAWLDASPGTFDGLRALVWSPVDLPPEGSEDAATGRHLLLVGRQTLYVLDIATGQIAGLAVACPTCTIERAAWLP